MSRLGCTVLLAIVIPVAVICGIVLARREDRAYCAAICAPHFGRALGDGSCACDMTQEIRR